MKTRILAALGAAFVVLGLATPAFATNGGPPPANTNEYIYWCGPDGTAQQGASGVKFDPVATPFVVPAPPAGWQWTLLVLKAGSTGKGGVVNENETFANPVVGQSYVHSSGKDISHAILCKTRLPDVTVPTTLPTTVPTTLPTTVPTTIATTVPTTIATTVPTTIATTVPTTIATTVPTTVATTLPPTTVATTLPTTTTVATTLPPTTQAVCTNCREVTTVPTTEAPTTTVAATTVPVVVETVPVPASLIPPAVVEAPPSLPVTGSMSGQMVAIGIASVLGGFALVALSLALRTR